MKLVPLFIFLLLQGCVKDESQINNSASTGAGTGDGSSNSGGAVVVVAPDPLASHAWHLNNNGSQKAFSYTSGVSGEDINVETVHTLLNIKGRNVRIAVSDSGTEVTHPDLEGNALTNEHRNYSSTNSKYWRKANPYPSGGEFHGTGVAGLIAALGWNGIGSRGVAPLAKFAAFRYVLEPNPADTAASRLAKNLDQLDGNFDIFNYSYGLTGYIFAEEEPVVKDALKLGATTFRNGKGALYVQSAGNSASSKYLLYCSDEDDPSCYEESFGNTNAHEMLATPYKIVVGATNAYAKIASYSTPGSGIWVSAPGGEDGVQFPAMITTDITGCNSGLSYNNPLYATLFDFGLHSLNKKCDYTNRFNGTSSAAPIVSGVIALMLEANKNLTWRDVKHILALTSDRIDYDPSTNALDHPTGKDLPDLQYDYRWVKNGAGRWYSNYYGFGHVNAGDAVSMALSYDSSTLGKYQELFYKSGSLTGMTIPDQDSEGVEHKIWVGHRNVVESVEIKLTTNHTWPGELAVHLISPSGTESRLLNLNSNIYSAGLVPDTTMITNAFYGEPSDGYWTIKIYDGDSFGTGDLQSWKLQINGHRDPQDALKPLPMSNISFGPTPLSNSMSPVFSFTHSPDLLKLTHYEVAVGTTPLDEDIKGWTNIGLTDNSLRMTGLTLEDEKTYFLKIRAVNTYGYSSVQILSWKADF